VFSDYQRLLNNVDLIDAEHEISLPMENTCQWIFDAPQFISWIDSSKFSQLLCIHGRVGSGKSTLTKYIVNSLRDRARFSKQIILSFFLDSNEHDLSRNTPGEIYRSLLIQLLREPAIKGEVARVMKMPWISKPIVDNGEHARHYHKLRNVLKDLLHTERSEQVVVVIDAVDKCTDTDALVQFFQDLVPSPTTAKLTICFTGRQVFPIIDRICTHIAIETHNQDDIAFYIEQRLEVGGLIGEQQQVNLQQFTKEEASGIFLWAVLVTNILRGYIAQGKDYEYLTAVVERAPKEMMELYRDIVRHAAAWNEQEEIINMVHVLQWVLFSARPLTLEEWHHVFAFIDNHDLQSIEEWNCSPSFTESDEQLLQRIDRICCGLVDARDQQAPTKTHEINSDRGSLTAGAGSFESYQYIDVIHSSVREFLIDQGGFRRLNEAITDPVAYGHAYILNVYIRYSFLKEMRETFKITPESLLGSRLQALHSAQLRPWTKAKVLKKLCSNEARAPGGDWTIEEENNGSERMSLGSSAGSSIHSNHLGCEQPFATHHVSTSKKAVNYIWGTLFSTRMPFLSLTTPLDTSASKFYKLDQDASIMSNYLRGLHDPGPSTLEGESTLSASGSSVGSLTSDDKFHPAAQRSPSLWQYCQHVIVHHATTVQSTGSIPVDTIDFLLGQDTIAWTATHGGMRHGATIAYFAARWNLISWLVYLEPKGLLGVPGGKLGYPIIVAAKYNY
jgi:hypothetical protein